MIDDDIETKEDSQIEIVTDGYNMKNIPLSESLKQLVSSPTTPILVAHLDIVVEGRKGRRRPRLIRTGSRSRPRKLFSLVQEGNQDEHKDSVIQPNNEEEDDDVFAGVVEIASKEAMVFLKSEEWKEAIQSEVESLIKNNTFEIIKKSQD